MKCPFCQFDNEDGALFCEQCKSDLGVGEPVAVGQAAEAQQSSSAGHDSGNGTATDSAAPVAEALIPVAAVVVEEAVVTEAVAIAEVPGFTGAVAEAIVPQAVPVAEEPPAPVETSAPAAPSAAEEPTPPVAPPSTAPTAASDGAQAAAATEADRLPADAKPKLVVLRGQRVNVEFPLYEGDNYIGRADDKAVDVDLEDQEPQDRVWSSRQHALITLENGKLAIEDLNSTNGTFVNRMRLHPGQKRPLQVNDVIQIGTVQMKVKI